MQNTQGDKKMDREVEYCGHEIKMRIRNKKEIRVDLRREEYVEHDNGQERSLQKIKGGEKKENE